MEKLILAVDKNRELILEAEKYIWANPETGYKEFKTNQYMISKFKELGYELVMAEGITGFYTVIDTGREGPEALVLCELDSVVCPSHPDSDKETGAVHACGHHAQCAAMLGIAAALKEKGALDEMCGKIRLCAVPAEELLEIEYRMKLKREGKIKYFSGKSEFLSRGYFDGVDLAFMVHTSSVFALDFGMVGCIAKKIIYKGVAAHAGGSPWCGVNALYAANCGINAVNAIRETFKDLDFIRVHPIMTAGGDMVNAIPERAELESYVRGRNFDAIIDANSKVNRAFIGAALSLGANVEVIDTQGYSPLENDTGMINSALEAFKLVFKSEDIRVSDRVATGSTDMGDLSCIMPVVHAYAGGAVGKGHGNDYKIDNAEKACIDSAKWQVALLHVLMSNGAKRAKEIVSSFKPRFASKKEFLDYVDSICTSGDRIKYHNDGTAEVILK